MSATIIPPDRPTEVPGPVVDGVEYRPQSRRYACVRIEDGVKDYLDVWGYKSSSFKTILYHCIGVFTLGLGYLVLSWKPTWIVAVKKAACELKEADTIVLKDCHGICYIHKIENTVLTRKPKFLSQDLADFALFTADPGDANLKPTKSAKNIGIELLGKADLQHTAIHSPQHAKIYTVRFFTHQHVRYAWHRQNETFQRLSGTYAKITCGELHARRGGVSDEDRSQKRALFGDNLIVVEVKSIFHLLIEEVLNPFYCFQIFCIVLWCTDNYYIYASCVLVISVFGISISLYETRKQRIRLRNMVLQSTPNKTFLVMLNNGEFADRLPEELVPGDIIVIPKHGCLMPCDAALIEGNCIVNEGILTGESAPVTKVPLSSHDTEIFSMEEHKRNILFHGTSVIQTRFYEGQHVLAVVCQIGFYTVKGDLIRSILYPKPIGFKFYRDAIRLIGIMAIIAGCGMTYSIIIYAQRKETLGTIIVRALDLITIVVPPALPAALTVGIVYSQRRLKKMGIFCISPSRINVCGKIKLMCFDKTGTLTEEGLDLMGVVPASDGVLGKMVADVNEMEQYNPLVIGMAACHSLTMIGGEIKGDPLDLKLFEATNWILSEPGESAVAFDSLIPTSVYPPAKRIDIADEFKSEAKLIDPVHIGIIKQFPFSSGLQRMSVLTRATGDGCFSAFVKGAPEKIVSLSRYETVPLNFHKTLHFYAHQGYRVIAMAYRTFDSNVSFHQISRLKRDEIETDLVFVGLMIMRNNLKPESTAVIEELNASDIQTVMVTGDNMLTAISVGRDCGMIRKGEDVITLDVLAPDERTSSLAHILWRNADSSLSSSDTSLAESDSLTSTPSRAISANEFLIAMERPRYHLAMTGRFFTTLIEHFPEIVPKVLVRGTIFARFSPDQKTQLIEKYMDLDYITGMVGDGANDCGALKAAHAGISLSEAEASVASPFTSNRNTIECVPTVIKEGRCALVTSFGVFKYMALYSIVQFVAMLILYEKWTMLHDAHFLYLDMLITTAVCLLMGYTNPHDHLVRQRPHGSLLAPAMIVSLASNMIIVVGFQTMAIFLLQSKLLFPWKPITELHPNTPSEDLEREISWESTLLFLVAAFQDLIMAFVFSKGPPYRKRIYSNKFFLAALIILVILTGTLLLWVPNKLSSFMSIEYNHDEKHLSFRLAILGLMAVNFLVAVVVEEFMVDRIWFKRVLRVLRRKKQSKSAFKKVRRQLDLDPCFPPVGQLTYAKCSDVDTDPEMPTSTKL